MTQPLATFMKNTLERKRVPNYLKSDIQLKHVQSVWILLKFTQTDSFMRTGQVGSYVLLSPKKKGISNTLTVDTKWCWY